MWHCGLVESQMRPRKKSAAGKRRTAAVSPERERPSFDSSGFELDRTSGHHRTSVRPVGSLLDDHAGYLAEDGHQWFSDEPIEDHNNINGGIGGGGGAANPRSFPYSVKQQCWEKAEKVKGRDPDRWRRDPLGNIIFRKLVGCPGCLCHDYDHILPYSKGVSSQYPVSLLEANCWLSVLSAVPL
ncbi:hypothetical protein M5K25_017927 [Dendrobium thyrsiflorum]|uniref:HNH endonuclease n=1 Tax=Dendrobium thyrsiflorum TaxID=117978 RepID=A0ABD0UGS0_DENTH